MPSSIRIEKKKKKRKGRNKIQEIFLEIDFVW